MTAENRATEARKLKAEIEVLRQERQQIKEETTHLKSVGRSMLDQVSDSTLQIIFYRIFKGS